jgi:hypothetical protein
VTPIEMQYSWIGYAYHAVVWIGRWLAEKSFDVVLAAIGTWLGYWLAKRHLEHFVSGIVERMDAKYLNLNREMAFHRAVNAMLPELPQFYLRPSKTLSPKVAGAIAEFTSWSTAIDDEHTDAKSMESIAKEAYNLAAKLIASDMGFKEEVSVPRYTWEIEIPLPVDAKIEEIPHLTIFDWDAGLPIVHHALMQETTRTPASIRYDWMWDTKDVPCGLYAGVVNFTIGATENTPKAQFTARRVGNRLRIFLKLEKEQLVKTQESVPW